MFLTMSPNDNDSRVRSSWSNLEEIYADSTRTNGNVHGRRAHPVLDKSVM